jgi:protein tyrosine phosphatase (PTP) superfamily phosphohydrolase (DUF442 family)
VSSPLAALQGVVNACQVLPTVFTSGQPGPEHFRALKATGVEVVVDFRHPMEPRGYDQEALMRALDFDYRVIAVTDEGMTDQTLDRIRQTLREVGERQILVHCNSGNRVGGALLPYLVLDQGFTEEEATTAALRMGLRSAGLLEWGLDYIRARNTEGRV